MSEVYENSLNQVTAAIADLEKNITLIYAFNGVGKTRLSVGYKDETKKRNDNKHSGVYYNAYSEDLFNWFNDEENDGENIRLTLQASTLNQHHSLLDEINVQEKLDAYKPNFNFFFEYHDNLDDGIKAIKFTEKKENLDDEAGEDGKEHDPAVDDPAIKISRGEEQIFKWCFFLTLFDIEGWTGDDNLSTHFFIDDPVSSLDDHNIFVTVSSLMELIEKHFESRKIVITTHHFGFMSILHNWLTKGEKGDKYKKQVDAFILKKTQDEVKLVSPKNDVFLYHLELMQILKRAIDDKALYAYHFSFLRQILENIGSFLGAGRISYVLEKIGFNDSDRQAQIINTMAHKNVFRYEAVEMVEDNVNAVTEIYDMIQAKYNFVIHAN